MTVIIKLCFPKEIYSEMKSSGVVRCREKLHKDHDD